MNVLGGSSLTFVSLEYPLGVKFDLTISGCPFISSIIIADPRQEINKNLGFHYFIHPFYGARIGPVIFKSRFKITLTVKT